MDRRVRVQRRVLLRMRVPQTHRHPPSHALYHLTLTHRRRPVDVQPPKDPPPQGHVHLGEERQGQQGPEGVVPRCRQQGQEAVVECVLGDGGEGAERV